jgi:hypothetical protein
MQLWWAFTWHCAGAPAAVVAGIPMYSPPGSSESVAEAQAKASESANESLAERVRSALVQHALAVYEDAGARGLCAEGAWEAVIGALRNLDLTPVIQGPEATTGARQVQPGPQTPRGSSAR